MPRQQTEMQAIQIVTLLQEGNSQRYVARCLGVSQSVVSRTWSRYQETNDFRRRQGQGRRRITDQRTDRAIVRHVVNNPVITARQVRDEVREICGNLSVSTIRRRLRNSGLRSCQRARAPALTLNHRHARLRYASTHVRWNPRQWNHVLFSDESRFCLYGNDRRERVWRRRGERYQQRHIVPVRAFHGGSVMVWAGISCYHRTELVIVPPPGLTAQRYVDEILRPYMLPMMDVMGQEFIFMQDNAPPHTAQYTIRFFRENNITLLNHPAMSPDLNPIEHVWDMLARRLRNVEVQPTNLEEMTAALQQIWREITQDDIRRCINIRVRCQEVIRQRGGNTRF